MSYKVMTTNDVDPEICGRSHFGKMKKIIVDGALEAVRRGHMDVSEAKSQCSRTVGKDNGS